MEKLRMPAGTAETELVEKRSRFLSHIWPVQSEEEARGHVEQMKKQYRNARHNCWCYRVWAEDIIERFSDDGEPQGTAGQPMLTVFQRKEITNVCCIITRYFGGILLGTGGLVRAYTQSAINTLEKVGTVIVCPWVRFLVSCPYAFSEQIKQKLRITGGILDQCEYTDQVIMSVLVPENVADAFSVDVSELTAGECYPNRQETIWRSV